jgi:putative Mn2+ efflux pump MntP
MSGIEIIIVAVVEAMDCFAVAISTGLSKSSIKYSRAMLQAVSFGVFQGGMTLLGFFLGNFAERWFNTVGTAIACGILCILGARMIWSAVRGGSGEGSRDENAAVKNLTVANILLLSIATSIDAFAVGISFAFVKANMVFATSAIALASFATGVVGFEIGRHTAKRFKTKIPEIVAGVILIAIGVKMFL